VVMFCGLMWYHPLIYIGAAAMVGSLYWWLLSPLEPEHHAPEQPAPPRVPHPPDNVISNR
jgi:hypothetical protein